VLPQRRTPPRVILIPSGLLCWSGKKPNETKHEDKAITR